VATVSALGIGCGLFRADCGFALRNARVATGFARLRRAGARTWTGRYRAIAQRAPSRHVALDAWEAVVPCAFAAKTFSGSRPILSTIETKRLSARRVSNSVAMPIKCHDDECSSYARC